MQQNGDVVALDFDADAVLKGNGVGLVRRLLDHGGETEELTRARLLDDDFLVIFIHGGDPD